MRIIAEICHVKKQYQKNCLFLNHSNYENRIGTGVTSLHYRSLFPLSNFDHVRFLETNVPTLRITTRQITLATVVAVLALSTAACATKPPAPVEPAPLVKKG